MNFKPVDKKYILNLRWYILACLALMVFSISMESYYNKTGYGKRELDKFNKTLSIKEKKLLEGFSQFENLYKESSDSLGLFSIIDDKFFDSFPEDGLAYFFYKDSSLVFWSDNIIPVPGELSQLSDSSIIRYGNALYYSKIKNLDSTSLYGLIHLKTEHPYMNKMLDNGFRKEFGLSDEVKIRTGSSGKNQVLNLDGEYLFSLDFNNSSKNSKVLKLLVILLWVSCFLCFIILMRRVVHN